MPAERDPEILNVDRDKRPSLLRASTATSIATLTSRLMGLARDVALATVFPREQTDIFWAAFRVPNSFRQVFGEGAVSVAFIPTFTKTRREKGDLSARRLFGMVLAILLLATGTLTLLGIFAAPWIVDVLIDFPNGESGNDRYQNAVFLVRYMFPYLILICAAALVGGALNVTGRFFMAGITPIFLNFCMIVGAFLAWRAPGTSLTWLASGVLVGGLLQLSCQLPSLWKSGMVPTLEGGIGKTDGLGHVFGLFVPASLTFGIRQINTLVNTYFASTLGKGPISYLFYADRLAELPLAVFGFAIATASLPRFSSEAVDSSKEAIRHPLIQSLKGSVLVLAPASVGLVVLGEPLVDLLFNRGRFAAEGSLGPTVAALQVFAWGLVPFAFLKLASNLSFALGEAKNPVLAGIFAAVANIFLAYWLRFTSLAHAGVALAFVLSSVMNLAVQTFYLRHFLRWAWFLDLAPLAIRVAGACAAMGIVLSGWNAWGQTLPSVVIVAVGAVLGIGVYSFCGFLLFRDQMQRLLWSRKRT